MNGNGRWVADVDGQQSLIISAPGSVHGNPTEERASQVNHLGGGWNPSGAWFVSLTFTTTSSSDNAARAFLQFINDAESAGWQLTWRWFAGDPNNNQIGRIAVADDQGNETDLDNVPCQTGVSHQISFSYAGGQISVFLDGNLVGQGPFDPNPLANDIQLVIDQDPGTTILITSVLIQQFV